MPLALDTARLQRSTRRIGLLDILALGRQRRALAQLDDHRLRDLGISQADALTESQRPVWDVPSHWQR